MNSWFPNVQWEVLWQATLETLQMTAISVLASFIIGIILGLVLFLTATGNLWENRLIYVTVGAVVNIGRSIPFIILIILLIPFTSALFGTMIGVQGALPALIIGTAPFYARLVEIGLREIDKGVIEAAQSMGGSIWQIMIKVLIPESLPALVSGITVTAIALVSYTAMAGMIGAGGLGNLAYAVGYQRNQSDVVVVATVMILILVFAIQMMGNMITKKLDKR